MADSDSDSDDGEMPNVEAMALTEVNIREYDKSYTFDIDMPGVDFANIRVQVKSNNVLFISSTRRRQVEGRYIKMERKFALPENADTDKITGVIRDDVLTVTVEKLVAPPPPPPIEVKVKEEETFMSSCKDGCKVDRISMLPDELLVSVLSLLSFKEVCCASVISRRWRYLHTLTPKLDFDGSRSLRKMEGESRYGGDPIVVQEKEREYIESVGRAVRLHQSSPLSEFRVVFTLTKSHTQLLDEWVEFALYRKVEALNLHLTDLGGDIRGIPEDGRYAFPCKYLNSSNLKKLSTYFVNVSGDGVEMILRECPVLEQLSIGQSSDLASLEISKPFPSFRMLEILMCRNLKSVVVRDSNITSVRYKGQQVKFVLENVGLLREIWVGGTCTESLGEMFSTRLLPHVHIFKIGFCHSTALAIYDLCPKFCEAVAMTSLKELVVDIPILNCHDDYLLPLIHLVKASPNLQRFVIQAPHIKEINSNYMMSREIPRVKRERPRAYPHLKEVDFVGYCGTGGEVEILKHFMENAISLESITIDTWGFNWHYEISWDRIPRHKFNPPAFARANALKQCAPSGINVYIPL